MAKTDSREKLTPLSNNASLFSRPLELYATLPRRSLMFSISYRGFGRLEQHYDAEPHVHMEWYGRKCFDDIPRKFVFPPPQNAAN